MRQQQRRLSEASASAADATTRAKEGIRLDPQYRANDPRDNMILRKVNRSPANLFFFYSNHYILFVSFVIILRLVGIRTVCISVFFCGESVIAPSWCSGYPCKRWGKEGEEEKCFVA